jgi:hypothetical protein
MRGRDCRQPRLVPSPVSDAFLGINGPFDIILADEDLPLTEEKFVEYTQGWGFVRVPKEFHLEGLTIQ